MFRIPSHGDFVSSTGTSTYLYARYVIWLLVFFLWYDVQCVVANNNSSKEGFAATIRTHPVSVGKTELRLRLKAKNEFDFPVRIMWTKASCACTKPKVSGSGPMSAGETRNVDVAIALPSTESAVNVSVNIYGFPDGQPIPEGAGVDDALVVATFHIQVPVIEPVKVLLDGDRLAVRSSIDPEFRVLNRSGHFWGDMVVDLGIDGASVECRKVESSGAESTEEVWECRVSGIRNSPELDETQCRFTIFREIANETNLDLGFEEVFSRDVPITFVKDYRLLPPSVQFREGKAYVVLDCSRGDARSVATKVEVRGLDECPLDQRDFSVQSLSDKWVRITFDDTSGVYGVLPGVSVVVPELNFHEQVKFRR